MNTYQAYETMMNMAKKHKNSPRNYSQVIYLDGKNQKMVWSDGFMLLMHDYHKSGETRTINHFGMESSLKYPNYQAVIPEDLEEIDTSWDYANLTDQIRGVANTAKKLALFLNYEPGGQGCPFISSKQSQFSFNPYLIKSILTATKRDISGIRMSRDRTIMELEIGTFKLIMVGLRKVEK